MITLKFRIYPTKSQQTAIKRQLIAHTNLYNKCLEERKEIFEKKLDKISCVDQIKKWVPSTKESLEGQSCSYSSLQQTVRRLDKAYANFYRSLKSQKKIGLPRFKKSLRSIEFSKHGDGWKIRGDKIYVLGVGEIFAKIHRKIIDPQRLVLVKDHDRYYAIVVDKGQTNSRICGDATVGFDLGMLNFVSDSNGEVYNHPLPYKKNRKQIAKLQSRITKIEDKKKKAKLVKAKRNKYRKNTNIRHDYFHKLANQIIDQNQRIAFENIKIQDLKSHINNINSKQSDLSWGLFLQILAYKAESAGCQVVKVDPAYTSQTCSRCGMITPKELSERWHDCSCGCSLDRDHNAALVIRDKAFNTVGLYSLA